MRLLSVTTAVLGLFVLVGCESDERKSLAISSEKAVVTVRLTRHGQPYTSGGEPSKLTLFGPGGYRCELAARGNGVYESTDGQKVPVGSYQARLLVGQSGPKGRGERAVNVTPDRIEVTQSSTQFTIEVKG